MSTYETGTPADQSAGSEGIKERAVDAVAEVDAGAMYVAGVAGEEVGNVAHDAKRAARGFLEETKTQLADQASSQQRRAAGALRSTADELQGLAQGTNQGSGGAATSAVRAVGRQTQKAADWLEQREPADVVREVRGYARRHTGAFLVIALGVGIVAGRITRALVSDARSGNGSGTGTAGASGGYRPALAAGTAGAYSGAGSSPARNDAGATATETRAGDTPIGDALNDQTSTDPLSPGVAGAGLGSGSDTTTDEWSSSGEVRR